MKKWRKLKKDKKKQNPGPERSNSALHRRLTCFWINLGCLTNRTNQTLAVVRNPTTSSGSGGRPRASQQGPFPHFLQTLCECSTDCHHCGWKQRTKKRKVNPNFKIHWWLWTFWRLRQGCHQTFQVFFPQARAGLSSSLKVVLIGWATKMFSSLLCRFHGP